MNRCDNIRFVGMKIFNYYKPDQLVFQQWKGRAIDRKSQSMNKFIHCEGCFDFSEKPKECRQPCLHDAFRYLVDKITESSEQIKALILRKLPDPPLQLVHSKEVCRYVGIVSKTLYRCEKQGLILPFKKDHTGKYFLHADMVDFKKKYHHLPD